MARIAVGRSEVEPSRRDHRFADPGWTGNPLLRRVMQAYLAAAQTAEGVVADTDLDWADSERVGFALRNPVECAGAVLEWPGRRPDVGVGPPTAVGAAAKRSDPRDGMFRAGFSAVVAIRRGRDRITPADEGSNL